MGRRGREAGPAQWAFSGDRSAPVIAGTTENLLQLPLLLYFYINSASVFECSDFDIFSFCTFQSSSSFFFSFFFLVSFYAWKLMVESCSGQTWNSGWIILDPSAAGSQSGWGRSGWEAQRPVARRTPSGPSRVIGVDGQESPRSPDPCSGAGTS